MAANLSGGGFSFYFETPDYQRGAVWEYLLRDLELHHGLYKCARFQALCRELATSYFVIRAAVVVVDTPTSPRKRSITKL